ncbi:unnamed protein product [Adineta ricciae]|uniref:Uncharacterized protein n=1 Tax=Adineta ricciae TaxID=249248 RepID=A0A815QM77_ADIRI|nr:unnamed protein product [Adineta ricciae]
MSNNGLVTIKHKGENLYPKVMTIRGKNDHVNLPENKELVIYELCTADFTDEGTLNTIVNTGKLDYLSQELGINVIELMPIQKFNYEYDGEQLKMKPSCEMIWMGTELGDARDVTSDQHQKELKTNWHVLDAPESPYRTLLNIFKKAIKLRRRLAALRSDSLDFFYENYGDRVLAYSRRSNENDLIIIIAHFSANNRDGYTLKNIPAKESTQFTNGMNESEILHVGDGTNELQVNLKPFEAKVLIQKQ